MTDNLHLIVDLDGTLIEEPIPAHKQDPNYMRSYVPNKRPYLKKFLIYIFNTFQTVSIWTSASRSWYEYVHRHILCDRMPQHKSFYRSITFTDYYLAVTQLKIDPSTINFNLKPLKVMWEGDPLLTADNTVFIDNNPITYSLNPDNAIPIKTYDTQCTEDMELMKLMFYFQRVVNYFKQHGTVTTLDKTKWSEEVTEELRLTA